MTPVEHLKAARALIEKPERWTQGTYARNEWREGVRPTFKGARCWCAAGALIASTGSPSNTGPGERFLCAVTKGKGIIAFNDSHTHAEVLALFDKAIALAEMEETK